MEKFKFVVSESYLGHKFLLEEIKLIPEKVDAIMNAPLNFPSKCFIFQDQLIFEKFPLFTIFFLNRILFESFR